MGNTVYLVGCALASNLEAECEDPSVRELGLADFAAPQVAAVATEAGLPAAIAATKANLLAEYDEAVEDGAVGASWGLPQHHTGAGYLHQTIELHDAGEVVGIIVVHKSPVIDGHTKAGR